jgi:hypothetical protein
MIVIGSDPPTGVTAIRVTALGIDFVGTWTIDITSPEAIRAILSEIGEPVVIVGVEQPKEVYRFGKDVNQADAKKAIRARVAITRSLMTARGQGDRLAAIIETLCPDVRVFCSQADKIRQAVLAPLPRKKSKTALDNHVAAMIPRLIRGWPERSNSHNRDAAVAALWAARQPLLSTLAAPSKKRARRSR